MKGGRIMTKIYYQPKTFLVKPIDKPEKISIFKHTVLFINESDNSIERAIPDFKEVYMDSSSANIDKINESTALSFFELVDSKDITSEEPIFSVTIFEGTENDPTKYNAPKVISATCVNGYSTTLEDVIIESVIKTKGLKRA